LSFEPLGEIVSESRFSSWSPVHLGGYALLAGLASVSALSLFDWLEWGVPLRFLHLSDGDYLVSAMLLSTVWLLPALRLLPWVRDTRELLANLLVGVLLAAYVIVAGGGFVTWQLFDLWPTSARWLRFLPLLPLPFPFALGEELLRRTFSKHRGHSALTAFVLWRLALLASVAYGILLLGSGQGMIVLHALPLFLLRPRVLLRRNSLPRPPAPRLRLLKTLLPPGSSSPSSPCVDSTAKRRCYTGSS
jgi:hypothetical protein